MEKERFLNFEGLTFDDILLVPEKSAILPREVNVSTKFSRNIDINIPLVSAAMDTVTESRLAIAIAREGGIGIIHKNMSIEDQTEEVDKVKRSESGVIVEPISLSPEKSAGEAIDLMAKYHISGIPIVNKEKRLVGILTNRDIRFLEEEDKRLKIAKIMTKENILVIDILTGHTTCYGLLALDSTTNEIIAYLARATILTSGGAGQLFSNTTNPEVATGDGIAMAYRGGAKVTDLEFIQFHPTALYHQGSPKFLISEAVRGEGAILKNIKGEPFMHSYHPLAELAPRDVVARAITDQMKKDKSNYVYLDATKIKDKFSQRFPTIYKNCITLGINPEKEYIPVAPAAHYTMGGIKTDTWGQTNLTNLYACGECSSTGVHGANRLASNSLLEGLVFGNRIAQKIRKNITLSSINELEELKLSYNTPQEKYKEYNFIELKKELQKLMWDKLGIIRNSSDLKKARQKISEWKHIFKSKLKTTEDFELANLIILADLITNSALQREESRGAHYREDFPDRDDINWKKHIVY